MKKYKTNPEFYNINKFLKRGAYYIVIPKYKILFAHGLDGKQELFIYQLLDYTNENNHPYRGQELELIVDLRISFNNVTTVHSFRKHSLDLNNIKRLFGPFHDIKNAIDFAMGILDKDPLDIRKVII